MITMKRLRPLLAVLGLLLATTAHAQSVYWIDTNFPMPRLGKANDDGTNPQLAPLTVESLPEGLAIDVYNGKLYWGEAAWTGARLNRAGVDLGGMSALVGGESSMRGVAFDVFNNKIYWTTSNLVTGGQVHRANSDGTGPAVIASLGPAANPRGIVVDGVGGRLFWADYDQNMIFTSDLNGAGVAPVAAAGLVTPWGLAFDPPNGRLYVSEYAPGRIQRIQLPGGALTPVLGGLGNPTYLAIDPGSGRMFWTEAGAGAQKVQRANLDGTGLMNLNLPLATYGGIAVGPGEPTETLLLTLAADAVADGIELRWQFGSGSNISSVRVERTDTPGVSWRVVDVALRAEGGATIALDRAVEPGHAYEYRLIAITKDGATMTFGPVPATAGSPVTEFALSGISPNPTSGPVRIEYAVAREAPVRLSVMDLQGRELVRLVDGMQTPGRHQAIWTGETAKGRAPAGLYFVLFKSPERTFTKRITITR
jgi:hypothetical protein